MTIEKKVILASSSRKEIREELVKIFLEEEPGKGKKELSSKYIYLVETVKTEERTFKIILNRPAYLNKGFDFIVSVPDYNFNEGLLNKKGKKARKNFSPSHSHITSDLKTKKMENPSEFKKVMDMIGRIYKCEEISDIDYSSLKNSFINGLPIELTLKLIKWLFIEQDITYWNFSGRAMLNGHILNDV